MLIFYLFLVGLRRFVEGHCIFGLCFVERGGALTHKHFQITVKGNFTNLQVLNMKSRDTCSHTFKGMIGYYMKDNGRSILSLFITMC
jgi:hypothetical protein